ncbi:MAG: exo-alpha-sialidase, partial [Flavobacteriales bacterium]|nr:exo-alpha-sialidase [Flavobacteriales bacterium]
MPRPQRNLFYLLLTVLLLLTGDRVQAQWTIWTDQGPGNQCDLYELNGTFYKFSDLNGAKKSTDNGATWQQIGPWTTTVRSLNIVGNAIYVGTFEGLFRSDDEGDTWVDLSGNFPFSFPATFSSSRYVKRVRGVDGILFALIGPYAAAGGYRSADNGATWTSLPFVSIDIQDVVSHNGAIFLATSLRVFRSVDLGENWTPAHPDGYTITGLWSNGSTLYAVRAPGIVRTVNDGATWIESSYPYPVSFGYPLTDWAVLDGYIYVNAAQRLARSANGLDWEAFSGGVLSTQTTKNVRRIGNSCTSQASGNFYVMGSTVGIDEFVQDAPQVWPNPSAGTLSVALPEGWTVSTQYQVHNALGALVSSGTLANAFAPDRASRHSRGIPAHPSTRGAALTNTGGL